MNALIGFGVLITIVVAVVILLGRTGRFHETDGRFTASGMG